MEMFLQLVLSGLANGAVYSLVALTFCIIFKGTDVVNFATGEMVMLPAFIAYTFLVILKWPAYISLIVTGVLFPILLGFTIERFAIRPLIPAGHLPMVMGTFALLFALRGLARFVWGTDLRTVPSIFAHQALSLHLGSAIVILSPESLAMLLIAPGIMIVFYLFFKYAKLGKMMRASQQNAMGASIVGISILKMFSLSWIIGAIIASWAAILFAPASLVYADMGAKILFKGFAAAILGGFGVVQGAIIGGFLMGVTETLCAGYISTSITDLSSLLIIFIVITLRPTGILGKKAAIKF
jgi:branched-chain amino acid transport system permease protein